MPKDKSPNQTVTKSKKRHIEQYDHKDKKRINNPPVGLVTPETDPPLPTHKIYDYIQPVPTVKPGKDLDYDPHLDPQLVWAGKKEHSSFEVHTVSLHVHETIDPRTIVDAVRRRNGNGLPVQPSLFERPEEQLPLRDAIDFYKHPHGWSNRLIAGDSLLIMNSLLEKEGMAGQVQMVYIDPPYGIKYGSNFQPFVNKRDVKDGKDEDLTQEPEMIRAFRDTWELGIHSYLSYLRDRLLLAHELLHESGSVFVQINDENLHHVCELMEEVFGDRNRIGIINFVKTSGLAAAENLATACDYLVWFGKDREKLKYRQLFFPKESKGEGIGPYSKIELPTGERRALYPTEKDNPSTLPHGARRYRLDNLTKPGPGSRFVFEFQGKKFDPGKRWWGTTPEGMSQLATRRRLEISGTTLWYIRFWDDFPWSPLNNLWTDTGSSFMSDKLYVVQTTAKVIEHCVLMTTDPGDLVLDPTCGSGTTAYVAEQWGRRWITCDTSRVAVTLAKQRLMTAQFDYYELAHPEEGVGSGFRYKTVPHVTLKSIANNPEIRDGMTREQIEAAIAKYADRQIPRPRNRPLHRRSRTRAHRPLPRRHREGHRHPRSA